MAEHSTSVSPTVVSSKEAIDRTMDDEKTEPHAPIMPDPEYPSSWKLGLVLFALCLCIFIVALDQTIIAPALGAITTEFQSTNDIVRSSLPM